MHNRFNDKKGFTLVELAIVLVIIGLVVGGILVGQDLIHAAVIRNVVKQYEQYNSAVNVFKGKFNCLPGDCANAAAYGFTQPDNGYGVVSGDGLLQTNNGAQESSCNVPGYETLQFWRQLSVANLIDSTIQDAGANHPPNPSQPQYYLPTAKLGSGNYWAVYSQSGRNYYVIAGIISFIYTYNTQNGVTPLEAFSIDQKLDDGNPTTGIVTANINRTASPQFICYSATQTANSCVATSGGGYVYRISTSATANTPACIPQFRLP